MLTRNHFVLLGLTFLSVIAALLSPTIAQDVHYHEFADQRSFLGIDNFFNVVSNIPYLIIGLVGCGLILKESKLAIVHKIKHVYIFFFIGVTLVCLGSSYYHINPSNSTLLWDRLPMTIAFMSFFTIIIAEYIQEKTAKELFLSLLITGLVSVFYWYWSETLGQGDLRLYILVQFLPIMLMPIILWKFSPRFTHSYYFWLIIACYVIAKIFELADQWVFDNLVIISGRSIKHLVSAVGPYLFYLGLRGRGVVDG